ncbi:aldehyde dehydrogenase family protein [Rhizorhabdus dicambivorans]|uniref:Aldehyde dehydrogenase n=1 Tax=Rhizorhabdus dicambivorans TaxID=1850238 RepID=A0A2A4FPJ1_9SPHN|nr:aldehyde dehydrogenase family protein [Rhizorhabdus dicambivorans]ATE66303.1 aldehyde dehydrogenase [Rhizorhabdus dicambivorans]PCE39620.1 aldehyde dehydrogenase [Rhizorhabdus dicambivorans]
MSELTTTRWSSNSRDDQFDVHNSATGARIATVQGGGAAEVDAAVIAADKAFRTDWRWRPAVERGMMLLEIARKVREDIDAIAELETLENGKPLDQARMDVEACIAIFSFFGSLAGKIPGNLYDSGLILSSSIIEPYGVVGAIIPFNWPPVHTAGKIAPALAAGNTIVIKPPEQTPLCVMRIVDIIQSVLPPDVVHIVPGVGKSAGAALAGHKLVRKISFTGATATGAAIVRTSAENTTPTLLELGGKNAVFVMADADLDEAAKAIVEGGFFNQGEACTALSRVLVHASVKDRLVAKLAPAISSLNVGSGMVSGTHVGPLVTKSQQEKVLEYIQIGVREGAKIAAQAKLPTDDDLQGGYFVPPTMLVDVAPSMRVAKEEIFGPVVCVIAFETEDEAISIANDTDYGLTCAIFTRDHPTALRISRHMDVGMVFINNYYRRTFGVPFGGTKGSGYGREHAIETLKDYGRIKVISTPSGLGSFPYWSAVQDTGL